MGLTYVTATVRNLAACGVPFEKEFLVDTGAIDCMAPASRLHAAGIEVQGRDAYELANNQLVEYPYGFARITFMGAETVTRIIFGEEECEPILGVVALESTGIGVDPVTNTLRRMTAKPLKYIVTVQETKKPEPPNTDSFRRVLNEMLEQAAREGRAYVEISAGELHRVTGGYPRITAAGHRMSTCCDVMYRAMSVSDEIISAPPKGKGASLKIRYYLSK
jgi:5-methylcytosine-specific restriction protein A